MRRDKKKNRILRKAPCTTEWLEPRRLLAGNTITGTVFNDVNGNGVRDPGDAVVPGVKVYRQIRSAFGFRIVNDRRKRRLSF